MQHCLALDTPSIPEFKRRRYNWVSSVSQGSFDQCRLLDLSDDVLMVVMHRLLPNKKTLRGRDLAAYRDVANLAFTCRRLLKLFRIVRTTPSEVYGLFDQLAIDPSSHGQLRYPPVVDIRFFRKLIAESGTQLRRLSIPFLPSMHTRTLMQLLFSVCFHLDALYLADAGTVLSETSKILSRSPIDHLRIYFPSINTLASLAFFERAGHPVWHVNVSNRAHNDRLYDAIKNHNAFECKRHKSKLVVSLKDSSSIPGILRTVYPLFVNRISQLRFIEKLETGNESRLIISFSDSTDLESLLMEKSTNAENSSGSDENELRTLYIRSDHSLDLYLSSSLARKEIMQKEVKGVYFIDVRISLIDSNSLRKLCKCLLDMFDEQNEVNNLLVSREIVYFSPLPEIAHLLTRFKALKRIHFSERIRACSTSHSSHGLGDRMFLEHLPLFLNLLQTHCKCLETVNMSSCFPAFPIEKKEELQPRISHTLAALTHFESTTLSVSVDGVRRVLLTWLEHINLKP
eukprot:gb/GEZJ01002664.1/.p1 GENE.gb/GEZJ01002664.1/~~gb/GEZJ01002664.1/.p1  ORF type:complete len:514 (-),score=41.28 gb/GEZJ01002664.1/:394-1935(-)